MFRDTIQEDIQQFKTEMMMYRPFFGDILLRLPIVRDDSVSTACTDGRTIRWNNRFFSTLNSAQRHYVLMHEVFHTLLMHPSRKGERDPRMWNIAADMVVNSMCDDMLTDVNELSDCPLMERPPTGVFVKVDRNDTAERLYGQVIADAEGHSNRINLKADYRTGRQTKERVDAVLAPDLLPGTDDGHSLSGEQLRQLEDHIAQLIRNAVAADKPGFGSYYVPQRVIQLTKSKPISWRQVLKDYLDETISDDTSYTTPERKYIHMDLILPGHGLSEEGDLESLWAFVDTSGSISEDTMNQFLTQLYRIVKEFRCELNICYWDTKVSDVYRRITSVKQVLESYSHSSGGTDINCVYNWMRENKVKPDVLLILTDGYFGRVNAENSSALRPRDTVLVISNDSVNEKYKEIGKVCRLV